MRSKVVKDKKQRINFAKFDFKRLVYKYVILNQVLTETDKFLVAQRFYKNYGTAFKTRIKNRCVETGKARAPYRFFHLSRVMFRKLSLAGVLTGIQKSS